MHALQTLLENYADLAFDFFEAWAHRNIFVADTTLPIVTPHQQGLDLDVPLEKERELQIEVETLRRRLDNVSDLMAGCFDSYATVCILSSHFHSVFRCD